MELLVAHRCEGGNVSSFTRMSVINIRSSGATRRRSKESDVIYEFLQHVCNVLDSEGVDTIGSGGASQSATERTLEPSSSCLVGGPVLFLRDPPSFSAGVADAVRARVAWK